MQKIQYDEILGIYLEAKKRVANWFIKMGVVVLVGVMVPVIFGFIFDPDDAPKIEIKHIASNVAIISIIFSVTLFLFSKIAERLEELHDIGDGKMSKEIIEMWSMKLVTYRKASNLGLLIVSLLSLIGGVFIGASIIGLTGKLYSFLGGSVFVQFESGVLMMFFGFLMLITLLQVDPDPNLHGNISIYKELKLQMYVNKKDTILERGQNGLKWLPKKLASKNNERNIIRVVFALTTITLVLIYLLTAYVHENGAVYILRALLAMLLFGSVLSLVFLFMLYPALLVADERSMDRLYATAILVLGVLNYLIILILVVAKVYVQLSDSVEAHGRILVFMGLIFPSLLIVVVTQIFINYQRKKYNDWRQNKTAFNEKAPILFRSAVKAVEDYETKIDELQRELGCPKRIVPSLACGCGKH